MNANANEGWAARGAVALKTGAFVSVVALIVVIAAHNPVPADEASIEAAAAASINTPAAAQASQPATASASEAKPYYFPSQYELHATEPAEPVPTF